MFNWNKPPKTKRSTNPWKIPNLQNNEPMNVAWIPQGPFKSANDASVFDKMQTKKRKSSS